MKLKKLCPFCRELVEVWPDGTFKKHTMGDSNKAPAAYCPRGMPQPERRLEVCPRCHQLRPPGFAFHDCPVIYEGTNMGLGASALLPPLEERQETEEVKPMTFWADYWQALRQTKNWRPSLASWTALGIVFGALGVACSVVIAVVFGIFWNWKWFLLLLATPGWLTLGYWSHWKWQQQDMSSG